MSNKYHAKRTYSELCGRDFASKAECKRGEGLRLLEMAGEIMNLEYQPKFILSKEPNRKVTITLDFVYEPVCKNPQVNPPYGVVVYEDVKGVLTRDFRTKLAWLKEKYGIDVRLIR